MTVTGASRVSERRGAEKKRSRRYVDIDASLQEDKRRRAARKAYNLESSKKAHAKKSQPQRDAKMASCLRLLDAVLELEPWDTASHTRVGEAWEECGRRVPGYLKECGGAGRPGSLVRGHVTRMGRQLNDPTAKTTWKAYPEVMRRVGDVVGKMAATRRYRDKFGPQQQHGVVEPRKSNLTTSETAHASPEQPATALERQQQAAVESQKSTLSAAVATHASPEQPATVQQRQQRGAVKPKMPSMMLLALRSYAAAAEQMSAPAMVC